MNIFSIQNTLLDIITAISLISKVKKCIFSEQVDQISTFQTQILFKVSNLYFMLNNLTHHIDNLHDTSVCRIQLFFENSYIVISLICFTENFNNRLILHNIELLFVLLYPLLQQKSCVFTDEQLFCEGFNTFLSFQQNSFNNGD